MRYLSIYISIYLSGYVSAVCGLRFTDLRRVGCLFMQAKISIEPDVSEKAITSKQSRDLKYVFVFANLRSIVLRSFLRRLSPEMKR